MKNIKMVIEYDGGRYRGWQRQKESDATTIQGKIEDVLSRMTGEHVEIIGSGRTDAGVHAVGQVANFRTNSDFSMEELLDYCYRYLPEDIGVKNCVEVGENFHARYNATSKTYVYKICYNKRHDVFNRKYSYHVEKELDVEKMRIATESLIGKHDFKSFTSLKSKKKSTVREIYAINIMDKNGYLELELTGNGFLQNMVRIIVGTLLEVGLGNIEVNDIKEMLDKRDRELAGPTAPAQGLFLKDVKY